MRVALVHDWLNGMRGGEKCLEIFCELYPDAPIHTLFHEPGKIKGTVTAHPVKTSFLQRFPGVFENYRNYLPFFPAAAESFDYTTLKTGSISFRRGRDDYCRSILN